MIRETDTGPAVSAYFLEKRLHGYRKDRQPPTDEELLENMGTIKALYSAAIHALHASPNGQVNMSDIVRQSSSIQSTAEARAILERHGLELQELLVIAREIAWSVIYESNRPTWRQTATDHLVRVTGRGTFLPVSAQNTLTTFRVRRVGTFFLRTSPNYSMH